MRECPRCGKFWEGKTITCPLDGEPLREVPDRRIGSVVGGIYRLDEEVRSGGMATVYSGCNLSTKERVAVKVMHARLAVDGVARERFRREARNAASLQHPRIVEILDHGETPDSCPYLVMELLEGAALDQMLEDGALPLSLVLRLGAQLTEALARAHDLGIVHRDLKPANVFVVFDQEGPAIKLMDFGIAAAVGDARMTAIGQVVGTPAYLSPEAVVHQPMRPAMDLYSLGCVLFKMLTGRTPFVAKDPLSYMMAHMNEKAPKPSQFCPECPPALETLLLALLEKEPGKRPVDAHAVLAALRAIPIPDEASQHSETPAPPPPPPNVAHRPSIELGGTVELASLARWKYLASALDRVLEQAWSVDSIPPMVQTVREQFAAVLQQMESLYEQRISTQRALERAQGEARERRQRLGAAVEALALDLSSTREALRSSTAQELNATTALRAAEEQFRRTQETVHTREQEGLSRELVLAYRKAAVALEAVLEAKEDFELSVAERRTNEDRVSDLTFQLDTLRGRLSATEVEGEHVRAGHSEELIASAAEGDRLRGVLREALDTVRRSVQGRGDFDRELSELERAAGS